MPGNGTDEWIETTRARMIAKGKVRPTTKAGAVRALWPAIQAALENGQTLKTVRDWLEDEGVRLTYNQLTSYVVRIRRKTDKQATTAALSAEKITFGHEQMADDAQRGQSSSASKHPDAGLTQSIDPLANVRAREQKRPRFEYNPDFKEDELI